MHVYQLKRWIYCHYKFSHFQFFLVKSRSTFSIQTQFVNSIVSFWGSVKWINSSKNINSFFYSNKTTTKVNMFSGKKAKDKELM
jgi:hypothetical protein